jgi:hypothetical protein
MIIAELSSDFFCFIFGKNLKSDSTVSSHISALVVEGSHGHSFSFSAL